MEMTVAMVLSIEDDDGRMKGVSRCFYMIVQSRVFAIHHIRKRPWSTRNLPSTSATSSCLSANVHHTNDFTPMSLA